eukprot:Phypoly_transcript_02393.p1 GENE.Phypoly_transcript_02393~~Phypoly_transcript_02393.p1  ORF type:complete len:765 (+),score=85.20 Phypoly_transcript_02393:26-2296(+)
MAAKVETTTLWSINQDDNPIIGVSSTKNGFIITSRSSIRKQTSTSKYLQWNVEDANFFAPAIDVNVPSVLAALPIIPKKKQAHQSATLYFYNNNQHVAAVGKMGKTKKNDEILHLTNCSTKIDCGAKEKIFSIHPCPTFENVVIFVYRNGTVSLGRCNDPAPKRCDDIVIPQEYNVVWSFVEESTSPSTPAFGYLYTLLKSTSNGTHYKLLVASLVSPHSGSDSRVVEASCNLFNVFTDVPNADILTCCTDSKMRQIAILWSTGLLEVFKFATQEAMHSSAPTRLFSIPTSEFSLPKTHKKSSGNGSKRKAVEVDVSEAGFASVFLNNHFLAVVGRNNENSANTLVVWEVSYGSLQFSVPLSSQTNEPSNSTLEDNHAPNHQVLQILALPEGKGIIVATTHTVTRHRIHNLRSNLSAALGKNSQALGLGSQSLIVGDLASLLGVTKTPTTTTTTGSKQQLSDRISKFLSKPYSTSQSGELIEIAEMLLAGPKEAKVSPTFISVLISVSIENACWPAVNALLAALPASCLINNLFNLLIQADQLTSVIILVMVGSGSCMSDADQVAATRYVLDSSGDACKKCLAILPCSFKVPRPSDPTAAKNVLLEVVLSVKPENIFVSSFLRMISVTQVMALLQFLHYKIESFSKNGTQPDSKFLLPIALSWLSMVIDTHFTQLILTSECHTVMRMLCDVVHAEAQYCQDASKLMGELQQFCESEKSGNSGNSANSGTNRKRKPRPTSSNENIGQYKLETVSLWI